MTAVDEAPALAGTPLIRNLHEIWNGVIGRLEDRTGYVDPTTEDTYISVTQVLNAAEDKAWAAPWGAKSAATWMVEFFDVIAGNLAAGVPHDAIIKMVTVAAAERRAIKAEAGSYWHDVLEALLIDAPYPALPDHLRGVKVDGVRLDFDEVSTGLFNFLTDFPGMEAILAECTGACPEFGIAGTIDLVGRFHGMTIPGRFGPVRDPLITIDCKSGILRKSYRAQLAGYRRFTEVWLPFGRKAALPPADATAVLHLSSKYERGYKLIRADMAADGTDLDAPAWEWFLDCWRVVTQRKEQEEIRGYPLYPPLPDGGQPLPLIEDIRHPGLARFVGPLTAAGIRTLPDLTAFTADELLGSKRKGQDRGVTGIGEKAIETLRDLLGRWGLAFRGEVAPTVDRLPMTGPPAAAIPDTTEED